MRLFDLPVGDDGRNRCMLSPFASKTSRNQPSNTKFPFGTSVWLRGVVMPSLGWSLAFIDWAQQEFGVAGALSDDPAMVDAYLSGDCYIGFAKLAKAVPADATKDSHPAVRELYKQVILGIQYGMTEYGLAERLGVSIIAAKELLQQHHRAFPRFWRWSDGAVNCTLLGVPLRTVFGWTLYPDLSLRVIEGRERGPNARTYANFPVQGNAAEMMRVAAILATERGIRVCAPIHDAFVVEAPTAQIEAVAVEMQQVMRDASRVVLGGLELRSDVVYVHSPDRYMDQKRGAEMWNRVTKLIDEIGENSG